MRHKHLIPIFLFSFAVLAADITLVWDANDPVDQIIGYQVYQSTNVGGPYLQIGNTEGPKSTNFVVRNLTPGVYFFYVTASNIWTESLPSNTVKTPPLPSAVKKLVITK